MLLFKFLFFKTKKSLLFVCPKTTISISILIERCSCLIIGMAFSRLYCWRDENVECISLDNVTAILGQRSTLKFFPLEIHIFKCKTSSDPFSSSDMAMWTRKPNNNEENRAQISLQLWTCVILRLEPQSNRICWISLKILPLAPFQGGALLVNATRNWVENARAMQSRSWLRVALWKSCIAWILPDLPALPEGPKYCSGTFDFPPAGHKQQR